MERVGGGAVTDEANETMFQPQEATILHSRFEILALPTANTSLW
jgi:hypothetical protein